MAFSARNQLPGTVVSVTEGTIMAEVVVKLDAGLEMVSVITVSSAKRLHIVPGTKVSVVVKSTEVMLATEDA